MNPETGEIREFESEKEAELSGFTVPVKRKPRPKCKRCGGKGFGGRDKRGFYFPCGCTQ